jgi:hypothetical protein
MVKLLFSEEWRSYGQNCCILLSQGEKLDPAEVLGGKMSKTQYDADIVGFLFKSAGKFPMLTGDQEIERESRATGRPAALSFRTVRETFTSHSSSTIRLLSTAPIAQFIDIAFKWF